MFEFINKINKNILSILIRMYKIANKNFTGSIEFLLGQLEYFIISDK
jgi:hypothetical protein